MVKSDKKRKLEEMKPDDNDDTDIIIDDELSTNVKKSKYHCEICDITFNSSNSLSQHRRTQKHEKNKYVLLNQIIKN